MVADISGFSALMERDESQTYERIRGLREQTIGPLIAKHEGRIIKTTGDGFLAEFHSATAAMQCAIELQRINHANELTGTAGDRLHLRIGINLGDIIIDGDDVAGDGVNIAARLESQAPLDGICLSAAVRDQLREDLGVPMHDMGELKLKNISRPIRAFSVTMGEPQAAASPMGRAIRRRWLPLAGAAVLVLLAAAGLYGGQWQFLRPAAGSALPTISADPSIAVLPFADMSQAKDQEYFSDGIAEELLNMLAQVPKLRVIARTSSFSFKGKQIDIAELARRLNVAAVLEGSVRRSGNMVRVTVQLIRSADSAQLWSQTYDRKMDDIFKVQDEIAHAVVDQLQVTLLRAARSAPVIDPTVYPTLLQANFVARQDSPDNNARAIELYQQVLATAPRTVAAWNGLTRVYERQSSYGTRNTDQSTDAVRKLAEYAARKALESDPEDALAHANMGSIEVAFGSLANGAKYYQRALELDPEQPEVLFDVVRYLQLLGRSNEAIRLAEHLAKRDPASPAMQTSLARAYYYAAQWEQAIAASRTVLTLSPGYVAAHFRIGVGLLRLGKPSEALAEFELEPSKPFRLVGLATAYQTLGRMPESDAALATLIGNYARDWAFNIAQVYADRGDADHAFAWLDKAVANHDTGITLIAVSAYFNKIHDDPRWLALLTRVGRAPAQRNAVSFHLPSQK